MPFAFKPIVWRESGILVVGAGKLVKCVAVWIGSISMFQTVYGKEWFQLNTRKEWFVYPALMRSPLKSRSTIRSPWRFSTSPEIRRLSSFRPYHRQASSDNSPHAASPRIHYKSPRWPVPWATQHSWSRANESSCSKSARCLGPAFSYTYQP